MGTKSSVDQLNGFLRGEMAAVETYKMAVEKLDGISAVKDELLVNLKSHEDRVMMLQEAILQCGGLPAENSGPWGVFAKVVEGGAKAFGEKAAIAALEQGEDHGVADYKKQLDDLDALDVKMRSMVTAQLMPLQQQTHDRLSSLKKRMA